MPLIQPFENTAATGRRGGPRGGGGGMKSRMNRSVRVAISRRESTRSRGADVATRKRVQREQYAVHALPQGGERRVCVVFSCVCTQTGSRSISYNSSRTLARVAAPSHFV